LSVGTTRTLRFSDGWGLPSRDHSGAVGRHLDNIEHQLHVLSAARPRAEYPCSLIGECGRTAGKEVPVALVLRHLKSGVSYVICVLLAACLMTSSAHAAVSTDLSKLESFGGVALLPPLDAAFIPGMVLHDVQASSDDYFVEFATIRIPGSAPIVLRGSRGRALFDPDSPGAARRVHRAA